MYMNLQIFLRENGFQADLIHPLHDNLSLRAIALQSNECVITGSNMCLLKMDCITVFHDSHFN